MKKLIALTAALLMSSNAFAGYAIATVDEMHVDSDGFAEFSTTVILPGTCNWFIDTFRFSATSAAGKNMLTTLTTAKIAGIPLTIWYNDSTTPGTNQGTGCTSATMAVPTALGIR